MKKKFIIITTVPLSLGFFKGQIQVLKTKFNVKLVSSSGKIFDEICKNEQVIGYNVEMKREIAIFHDIVSFLALLKLFFRIKPAVVHGSTPKAGLLSMIAAWINKVPTRIYFVHGLRYQGVIGFKKHLLIFMEKLSCFFASHVYAVSYGVKDVLEKDGITKKNVSLIGSGSVNGIDVSFYSSTNLDVTDLRKTLLIEPDHFVFGFVGRLVQDKGIHELVNAFLGINKMNPKTRLLLVGDFENEDTLDPHLKNEIIMNSNIINVGFQKDVRSFLKTMNVFVFPSYREGFGVSLMEAAAMDVPAISSNITGCNEIIKNGYNGILVPAKSVNQLKKAMEKLVNNISITTCMSNVCRSYVEEKYEQRILWAKTLKSYCKISNTL